MMTNTNGAATLEQRAAGDGYDPWGGTPTEPPTEGGTPPARTGRGPAARALAPTGPAPYVPTPVPLNPGQRYPMILVEGPEYSGKSTLAFELAVQGAEAGIIGNTYVIAVDEDVDEFKDIAPDAQKLPHDGSWHQIAGCVRWFDQEAERARAAGELPPLLIVDNMTAVWQLLSEWAEMRARSAPRNRAKLAEDPNDEVDISAPYWNAANKRHRRLVAKLRTTPGVVIVTARAKMVAEIGRDGNPVAGKRVYKVESHKDLGYSTTGWVRVAADKDPTIMGLRRIRGGIQPGSGREVVITKSDPRFASVDFSLTWLLRDVMKFDPAQARPGQAIQPAADNAPDDGEAPQQYQRVVPDGADEAPGQQPADQVEPAGGRS